MTSSNTTKRCGTCAEHKPLIEFCIQTGGRHGRGNRCKACSKVANVVYHANVPKEKRMLLSARIRADKRGREFSIELSDIVIPATCPVLKIPMVGPSLDRIDSTKGYVKGNVRVISKRANLLKNNATIEEMELVLADLKATKT